MLIVLQLISERGINKLAKAKETITDLKSEMFTIFSASSAYFRICLISQLELLSSTK